MQVTSPYDRAISCVWIWQKIDHDRRRLRIAQSGRSTAFGARGSQVQILLRRPYPPYIEKHEPDERHRSVIGAPFNQGRMPERSIGADCKPADFGLRRFESLLRPPSSHMDVVQSGSITVSKTVDLGSNPSGHAKF